MALDFGKRLKNIEKELLDLKTGSSFVSTRNAQYTPTALVYTGMYRIVFDNRDENVFSLVYAGKSDNGVNGVAYPRTPSGNIQDVEIYSDSFTQGTELVPMAVISNVPVISITRI